MSIGTLAAIIEILGRYLTQHVDYRNYGISDRQSEKSEPPPALQQLSSEPVEAVRKVIVAGMLREQLQYQISF